MRRAIITVGLGFGDEGKGATVDYLARTTKGAAGVVRYSGGSQCGHNVVTPEGRHHCSAQIGAGAMVGLPTYLGPSVVVNPLAFAKELKAFGPATVYVDPECLVTTPLHIAINQYKECMRGLNRHGSCGHGIGEARVFGLAYPEEALRAKDLVSSITTLTKLAYYESHSTMEFKLVEIAYDLCNAARLWTLIDDPPFPRDGTLILEGAQGIMLDEKYGRHPHYTWSDVTAEPALALCRRWDVRDTTILGITRSYATRHGAGPLPSEVRGVIPNDPYNPYNKWQGEFRCGYLNLRALAYASHHQRVDALVINHLDQYPGWVCPDDGSRDPFTGEGAQVGMREEELLAELARFAPVTLTGWGPTHEHRRPMGDVQRAHRTS